VQFFEKKAPMGLEAHKANPYTQSEMPDLNAGECGFSVFGNMKV